MGCKCNVLFFILAFVLFPCNGVRAENEGDLSANDVVAEDEATEVAALRGVWDTSVSFAEETIEDFLPEEEDDDRIKTQHFNTTYSTNEKEPLPWKMGIFNQEKNYGTRNLDNTSLTLKARIGKTDPERNKSHLTHNIKALIKQKRYKDLETNSYDQVGTQYTLHYLKKKTYKVSGYLSYDRFDYDESPVKDLDRISGKVILNRFFNKGKVKLQAGYKREDLLQKAAGRKKEKNEYRFLFRWKVKNPLLHLFRVNTTFGYRDTKDLEGDDKDLDYKFNNSKVRVEHVPSKQVRLYHSAEYWKKEYKTTSIYDNEGYELTQGWKFIPYNTKEKIIYINATANFKKFNYPFTDTYDFEKKGISFIATIKQKGNWKTYAGIRYDHRNQKDNTKDRDDYKVSTGYEKKLSAQPLTLALNFEYGYRDYKNQGDKELYKVKLNVSYKI